MRQRVVQVLSIVVVIDDDVVMRLEVKAQFDIHVLEVEEKSVVLAVVVVILVQLG